MSTRAIASATGTSYDTVQRDLKSADRNLSPVTGIDGKTYSAHQPEPEPEVFEAEVIPLPLPSVRETSHLPRRLFLLGDVGRVADPFPSAPCLCHCLPLVLAHRVIDR